MIILYSIIAVFIAWIWVDFYRLIDIYDKEKLKYIILTFLLGCTSVLIVLGINSFFLDSFSFHLNGGFIHDFLYCFLKIGCVEEFAKIIPFLIIYYFFRDQINEPIDYIAFISISALGFSAAENVLYFQRHGPDIINGRAILSTVGHMFDTSIFAYGLILAKFNKTNFKLLFIIAFFLLAALSHGFYDFWLMYEEFESGGWIITILYFMVTISIYSTILNNALNNSSFFSYKLVVDSDKVAKRLLSYYGIVFFIQFILLTVTENFIYATTNFTGSIMFTGFIIAISVIRLSRFKLIQGRWQPIKIEFPFTIYQGDSFMSTRPSFLRIKIKGESYNETYINTYYEEYFLINPISAKSTYIRNPKIAYIEKKIFLKNDETFYVTKVFLDDKKEEFETMLIKPKTNDKTMVNDIYPIVALLKIENLKDIEDIRFGISNFQFKGWVYAKPYI